MSYGCVPFGRGVSWGLVGSLIGLRLFLCLEEEAKTKGG